MQPLAKFMISFINVDVVNMKDFDFQIIKHQIQTSAS